MSTSPRPDCHFCELDAENVPASYSAETTEGVQPVCDSHLDIEGTGTWTVL